jgi:hypothetical protein
VREYAGVSTDEENRDPPPAARAAGWRAGVEEPLARVAAERGIDFAPIPDAVAAALPGLADTVGRLAAGMDERERQWLAAVLAALSEHVQLASLGDTREGVNQDVGQEPAQ